MITSKQVLGVIIVAAMLFLFWQYAEPSTIVKQTINVVGNDGSIIGSLSGEFTFTQDNDSIAITSFTVTFTINPQVTNLNMVMSVVFSYGAFYTTSGTPAAARFDGTFWFTFSGIMGSGVFDSDGLSFYEWVYSEYAWDVWENQGAEIWGIMGVVTGGTYGTSGAIIPVEGGEWLAHDTIPVFDDGTGEGVDPGEGGGTEGSDSDGNGTLLVMANANNVTITLSGAGSYSESTSSNTAVEFKDIPAGTYTVTMSRVGYTTQTQTVTLATGSYTTIYAGTWVATGGGGGGGGGGGDGGTVSNDTVEFEWSMAAIACFLGAGLVFVIMMGVIPGPPKIRGFVGLLIAAALILIGYMIAIGVI